MISFIVGVDQLFSHKNALLRRSSFMHLLVRSSLLAGPLPPPDLDRHVLDQPVHRLLALQLEVGAREREVVAVDHGGQHNGLLEVGDVAADAAAGAGREGDEVGLQRLARLAQPALRDELGRLRVHLLVAVRHQRRDGHRSAARHPVAQDLRSLGRRFAAEVLRRRRVEAEGFVEAGPHIWQVLDLVIRRDDVVLVERGVDLLLDLAHALGVLDQVVQGVGHGDGGGDGAGVHHDADLSHDLTPLQVVRVAVLVLHQRLEEVVLLLALLVALEPALRELGRDAVPQLGVGAHAAVLGDDVAQLVEGLVPVVRPQEIRLLAGVVVQALAEVAGVGGSIGAAHGDQVITGVEEAQLLRKTNVGDGVEREEVGPLSVVDGEILGVGDGGALGKGLSAALVEVNDHSLGLVGHLVLPLLQILQCVRSRENLALAGMVGLVDDVSQVVVRSCRDQVGAVLGALGAVAVDVLDGADVAVRQGVRAGPDDGMLLVQLDQVCRSSARVCKDHERNIRNAGEKRKAGEFPETWSW